MNDQASSLRRIVGETTTASASTRVRVMCITSGKGGVGKTNISINLAIALASLNRRVFLLDADLGLANVDVLLNLTPMYTMEHVMSGEKGINDIILDGPGNIKILPSSSGVVEMTELDREQQVHLFRKLGEIEREIDYLIIDTGAGIAPHTLRFVANSDEILIVATPEPSSMTDAYSLIKIMITRYQITRFRVISNNVVSAAEGRQVYERLQKVTRDFLKTEIDYVGYVLKDPLLVKSVRAQRPLLEAYPDAPAARCIMALARYLEHLEVPDVESLASKTGARRSFWERLVRWQRK
jgi:flagellar biosynthesis protein FlhG